MIFALFFKIQNIQHLHISQKVYNIFFFFLLYFVYFTAIELQFMIKRNYKRTISNLLSNLFIFSVNFNRILKPTFYVNVKFVSFEKKLLKGQEYIFLIPKHLYSYFCYFFNMTHSITSTSVLIKFSSLKIQLQ